MSIVTGGIFGRVRNKTADLVFSQARSRSGTVNTIRQLVIPSNPRTPLQSSNRGKFGQFTKGLRAVGLNKIQASLNRSVDELPAFQSLMSLLMIALKDPQSPVVIPQITLGTDYTISIDLIVPAASPALLRVETNATGQQSDNRICKAIAVEWSDEALVSTDILMSYGKRTNSGTQSFDIDLDPVYGSDPAPTNGLMFVWFESVDGLKKSNTACQLYTP